MIIQKFGGTSVGSPQRMQELATIIGSPDQPTLVVLSAVSGTTNKLVLLNQLWNNKEDTTSFLAQLRSEYDQFIYQLLDHVAYHKEAMNFIESTFDQLATTLLGNFDQAQSLEILALGELISTRLFSIYMASIQRPIVLLNALDFMVTDVAKEPNYSLIEENLSKIVPEWTDPLYLTQGYICRNLQGRVDNLQRGGSDYTATIIGAVLHASEVQIWTDIDGMHNNDPRIIPNTEPVRQLSYREASELAYFGAKILHPLCVNPSERAHCPIRLKYTFDPGAEGTLISDTSSGKTVTAIAAKDHITAVKIRSGRMLNAYGFLKRIFEIFELYETPIDMITTSEVSVSVTIDDHSKLQEITQALSPYGDISYESDQAIICIVGDQLGESTGTASTILKALSHIPIRMISYGGSMNNISILVEQSYKQDALVSLHHTLFPRGREVPSRN